MRGVPLTFGERLNACAVRGNLTTADLARWFDRPYPTVRSWVIDGWSPGDGPGTRARMNERLAALEKMLRSHGGELRRLPQSDRVLRLGQLRNGG